METETGTIQIRANARVTYRPAIPGDATAIATLFHESYGDSGSAGAGKYPFTQLMDANWLRVALAGRAQEQPLVWFVAEFDSAILGTFAAQAEVGIPGDRVAECFGLVVARSARGLDIGTGLFRGVTSELAKRDAQFIISETRTAEPGGWKIVRKCGFVPNGIEPFCHRTPVGSEAMLLLSSVRGIVKGEGRKQSTLTRNAQRLREAVESGAGVAANFAVGTPSSTATIDNRFRGRFDAKDRTQVIRDDHAGRNFFSNEECRARHCCGVVGLRRLEGVGQSLQRYDTRYYVCRSSGELRGAARVTWDHFDERARILELHCVENGLQAKLIAGLVGLLEKEAGDAPLTTVIDVRADFPNVQYALEALGFFPTVYYPSMIAGTECRVDGIQYTRLFRRHFSDGLIVESPDGRRIDLRSAVDWPEAQRVMACVERLAIDGESRRD